MSLFPPAFFLSCNCFLFFLCKNKYFFCVEFSAFLFFWQASLATLTTQKSSSERMAGMHAYLSFTVNFWSSLYIFGNRNILLIKGPYRGTIINSKMCENLFNVLAVIQGCISRLDNLMCLPCCVWFYVGVDLCSLVYKLSIYWLHCLKGGCGSSSQLASSHTRKTGIF